MRTIASFALGIEVLFQGSAMAEPSWTSAIVVAQAPEAKKKDAQPALEQQPQPKPSDQQSPQLPAQQQPQATPPQGQEAQPAQEKQQAPSGVTQLPPVKIAPAPAVEPKPKPKPRPRPNIVRQSEPPQPVRTAPPRPMRRKEARPAPAVESAPAPSRAPARRALPSRTAPAPPRAAGAAPAQQEAAAPPEAAAPSEAISPANAISPAEITASEAVAAAEFAQGVPMSPVKGSEVPLDKVPSAVSQVTSAEIERSGSSAIEQTIQQQVPGAIISDINGNEFSTNIQYRGFTASPVEGTPQGLAVYQNGVRINEVFGDTVNWDLIPSSAIKSIAVVSGNPLYGLNALGGALNVTMKDGFYFQGVESETRFGSYGRFQEWLQLGKQAGNFAAYAAVEGIWDSGWRQFSPSEVRRAYLDLGVKDKDTEFHINFTGAENALGVVGPTPVQLLSQNDSAVYTNPQTTVNDLAMLSANGSVKLTDTLTMSGVGYIRSFHQRHVDGNVSDVAPCTGQNSDGTSNGNNTDLLCLQTVNGTEQVVRDQFGRTITTAQHYGPNAVIGEIDRSSNNTNSYGGSLQATSKDKLIGHDNIFIAGGSLDHGNVTAKSRAELGTINTENWVVTGNGLFVASPLDLAPVDVKISTRYYGLYFWDSFDVTDWLTATVGGRYNYEEIDLRDQLNLPGSSLTGNHLYTRFNPVAGATVKFTKNVSAFGSYAEANRAPTPAELACADPAQPCLLQNFLISDPNLKQVVSKTWQAGLRGNLSPFGYGRLDWSVDVFHTDNSDDILNVTSPVIRTRGYFTNAGNTRRQGVEASATYAVKGIRVYANYAYVDATFQSFITLPSPNNPFADEDGNIFVHPGNHLPTIPPHRVKFGFDYSVTDAWSVGADVTLASSQYFFGDESNQNPQLPGYGVVNFRTSYEMWKGVTLYGLINNVFDHKFYTYGTFFDTQIETVSGEAATGLTNPQTVTPAQPFSVYAGVKMRF
jgi:iron complex outermembrane recepter protein